MEKNGEMEGYTQHAIASLFGPNPSDDIGTHTTSHRCLFPFEGRGPASSSSPITDTMMITHFNFNPHRVFRTSTSTSSSFVHERSSTCRGGFWPAVQQLGGADIVMVMVIMNRRTGIFSWCRSFRIARQGHITR